MRRRQQPQRRQGVPTAIDADLRWSKGPAFSEAGLMGKLMSNLVTTFFREQHEEVARMKALLYSGNP